MCFALPTAPREQARPSRLPAPLRIAFGGIALLAILSFSLLIEGILPHRH